MMIEFFPDPDMLSDIDFGLDDHLADDHLGGGMADPASGEPQLAPDMTDLPLEPDPFLAQSQEVLTQSTEWAVAADIPLPNPFNVALAGGGLLGAADRRRARKAAERRLRTDGNER